MVFSQVLLLTLCLLLPSGIDSAGNSSTEICISTATGSMTNSTQVSATIERVTKVLHELHLRLDEINKREAEDKSKLPVKEFVLKTKEKKNWFQASDDCERNNMTLASIDSEKENEAVVAKIVAFGPRKNVTDFWLAGSDLDRDDYAWANTGRGLTYTDWSINQPDHDTRCGEVEHCMEISEQYNNKWNDFCCNYKQYYVCQYWRHG